jgi:hypothetical protein
VNRGREWNEGENCDREGECYEGNRISRIAVQGESEKSEGYEYIKQEKNYCTSEARHITEITRIHKVKEPDGVEYGRRVETMMN